MEKSRLSIIIPTLNEANRIHHLVKILVDNDVDIQIEIVIVNSKKSTDNLTALHFPRNAKVIETNESCRAKQLQLGAVESTGDILYFLHADTLPPTTYAADILKVLNTNDFGMFSYQFDSLKWYFKFNSWMTQWKGFYSGGGDQGLFLCKETFNTVNGFDTSLPIMEDYDLFWRLRKANYKYHICKSKAIVSSRKYTKNSVLRVNTVNLVTLIGFRMTGNAKRWSDFYKRFIRT